MPGDPKHDPVLVRYRTALNEVYGKHLQRVVLYGSYARGEARSDSDYDIAVFLHNIRTVGGSWIVSLTCDALLGGSERERTPLMHEIRKAGLDL